MHNILFSTPPPLKLTKKCSCDLQTLTQQNFPKIKEYHRLTFIIIFRTSYFEEFSEIVWFLLSRYQIKNKLC